VSPGRSPTPGASWNSSTRGNNLLLHELDERRVDGIGDEDLVLLTDGDHVGLAELARPLARLPHRGQDFPIQVEPQDLTREAVDHVHVLAADVETAWQPLVLDLSDELAVLVEELDSLVLAIGDPHQAFRVDGDAVSDLESTGTGSLAAPRLDELAVLVELQHARVALGTRRVPLRDEDVSIAGEHHIIRLIQLVRARRFVPLAGLPLGADRQQRLPIASHLDHDVAADVGGPEVPVAVDAEAVRPSEQLVAE